MNRILTTLLLLATFAGFGQNEQFIDSVFSTSKQYKDRFVRDGGVMEKDRLIKAYWLWAEKEGLYDDIKFAWMGGAAQKTRKDGIYNYVEKIYSLDDFGNDGTQTTESNQPFLSGNIAPNERRVIKQPTGENRTILHPSITFTGTLTTMIMSDSIGKFQVEQTDFTSETRTSIDFEGQLFAYIIHGEQLTESQKLSESNLLYEIQPEIPSVQIGYQTWATSNLEMVATPEGNVIHEMQQSIAEEQLVGGDFESGLIGSRVDGLGSESTWELNTVNPISGTQDGKLSITTGYINRPILRWNLTIPAGKKVKFSMDYKVIGGTLGIKQIFGDDKQIELNSDGNIHTLNYYYTVQNELGGYGAALYLSTVDGTVVQIDNVSVKELGWADSEELYNGLIAQQGYSEYDAYKECAAWAYQNNSTELGSVYGKLYTAFAKDLLVADIATQGDWGYHIATEAELTTLATNSGFNLKEPTSNYWTTANGTNNTGLTSLGGGVRNSITGNFEGLKDSTAFWCGDSDKVLMLFDNGTAEITVVDKTFGAYIRLVKD